MMRLCSLALFVALGLAPFSRGNPTRDLLRSVPPESTICFVAQDWKSHWQRLAQSPFAALLKKSELGRTILTAEAMEKIFAVEKVLADSLHLSAGQLRDDILGDAIVYAYRPATPDKPDDDAGVLMLKARNPKTLAKFLDDFNDIQKQSGELKALTEKKSGKLVYFHSADEKGPGLLSITILPSSQTLRTPSLAPGRFRRTNCSMQYQRLRCSRAPGHCQTSPYVPCMSAWYA